MRAWWALAAWLNLLTAGSAQQPQFYIAPQVDGRTEQFTLHVTDQDLLQVGPVWWRDQISELGTEYLRLHVVVRNPGVGGAVLRVEGGDDVSLSYPLADVGPSGLWTGIIPQGHARLALVAQDRPDGIEFQVDQVAYQAGTGVQYSTWGGVNESKQINDTVVPELVRSLASPVAKLVFQSGGLPRTCTGFLVQKDVLLTNQHCVHAAEACASMTVIFGYEYDADNRLRLGRQFRCAGFDSAWVDVDLDAALFRVVGSPGEQYGTISALGNDPSVGSKLLVIQHPGGKTKQVSFINCSAMAVPAEGRQPDYDFTHTCDTAGGSSGAPVFDEGGLLVGLHHYGFNEGDVPEWTDNRAVRFSLLKQWLSARVAIQ